MEKVQYNDFGTVKFEYDHVKPRVDVARLVSGSILIRFSESITLPTGKDPIKLTHSGIDVPGTVILEDDDRVALFNPASNLVNGQSYTLTITIDLEDKHQNTLAEEFSQPFTYLGADAIIYDRTAPEVEKVELISDVYHVTLTEEYDPATLNGSVDIFTSTKTYVGTVAAEGPKQFTFTPSQALDANTEYTFRVKSSLLDLEGKGLTAFSVKYAYDGSDDVLFEKPSETLHGESYVKNNVLFQGREYDPETGLYYFRARYYDPKLGLFLQPDPMGYQDSMNPYQAFGNNPVNFTDPSGMVDDQTGSWYVMSQMGLSVETIQNAHSFPTELVLNPRVQGFLQASLGFAMAKMGIALTTASGGTLGWLGAILCVKGYDNMQTGGKKMFSGKNVNTMTYELTRSTAAALTKNPKVQNFVATLADAFTDIVPTIAGARSLLMANRIQEIYKAKYIYDTKAAQYREVATGRFISPKDLPWPEYPGFSGKPRNITLKPGTILGRFGSLKGEFAGLPGATPSELGLPPSTEGRPYFNLRVLKPANVQTGFAEGVEEFSASGRGIQFLFKGGIESWIKNGYLEVIK